jgi:transposase
MGHLVMSEKERRRLVELRQVAEGKESLRRAAERLGLSYRQGRRVYRRYRQEGEAGLVHRSRGRRSNRRRPDAFRDEVLTLYRHDYEGWGPTLAAEKLAQRGKPIDHETLRRWLLEEGRWQKRRQRMQYRRCRPRRERWGELVQMDGSFHDWLGQGHQDCLMNMVDDATGHTWGGLFEEETTEAAMRLLWRWIEQYGIPRALYTDHKNVYLTDREPTVEESLAGQRPRTAFGQVCEKLGIEIIGANSPQAKGRVERSHGVYQDRLVKELKLAGITTRDHANAYLEQTFLRTLNAKFAKEPISSVDAHRPLSEGMKLEELFVWEERRQVGKDWTVRYQNRRLQILRQNPLPPARSHVTVQQRLDRSLHLYYRDAEVRYEELEAAMKPTPPQPVPLASGAPKPARRKSLPPPDHPWRRPFLRRRAIPASRNPTEGPSPPAS